MITWQVSQQHCFFEHRVQQFYLIFTVSFHYFSKYRLRMRFKKTLIIPQKRKTFVLCCIRHIHDSTQVGPLSSHQTSFALHSPVVTCMPVSIMFHTNFNFSGFQFPVFFIWHAAYIEVSFRCVAICNQLTWALLYVFDFNVSSTCLFMTSDMKPEVGQGGCSQKRPARLKLFVSTYTISV